MDVVDVIQICGKVAWPEECSSSDFPSTTLFSTPTTTAPQRLKAIHNGVLRIGHPRSKDIVNQRRPGQWQTPLGRILFRGNTRRSREFFSPGQVIKTAKNAPMVSITGAYAGAQSGSSQVCFRKGELGSLDGAPESTTPKSSTASTAPMRLL